MSHRPIIKPNSNNIVVPIINAVSTAADIVGPATIIQMLPGLSFDISWTGTTNGTIAIEVSNTFTQNADGSTASVGNWTALPTSAFTGTYPVPSGSAGSGFLDVIGTEAYAIRLHYTRSSGTGTMTVVVCGKVL